MRKFTTGEFAKFCDVPKGTILFYDKKPPPKGRPEKIAVSRLYFCTSSEAGMVYSVTLLKMLPSREKPLASALAYQAWACA